MDAAWTDLTVVFTPTLRALWGRDGERPRVDVERQFGILGIVRERVKLQGAIAKRRCCDYAAVFATAQSEHTIGDLDIALDLPPERRLAINEQQTAVGDLLRRQRVWLGILGPD